MAPFPGGHFIYFKMCGTVMTKYQSSLGCIRYPIGCAAFGQESHWHGLTLVAPFIPSNRCPLLAPAMERVIGLFLVGLGIRMLTMR
jgi:hypothetical protein